jgi:DNA-binding NarL/FixJ family response regulator
MVTLVAPPQIKSSLCTSQEFSAKFRVAVAEDQPRLLHALVTILARDFDVIATAADGQTLLQSILEEQPDVVVVDLGLPDMNGLELTRRVVQNLRHTRVVLCSVEDDPELVNAAFEAGASGYVWKNRIACELNSAVRLAATGRQFTSVM